MRALPVALTLMNQARARKHDTDRSNGLTDQASGLLGRDAVPAITRLRIAGPLPDCGAPARETDRRPGWHCAGIRGVRAGAG